MKTIKEIRDAFLRMHKYATTEGASPYMSIPADPERDADLILSAAIDELERLRGSGLKVYVHDRLDRAGVPVDPPGPHRDAGCRIGQRLNHLLDERTALRAQVAELQSRVKELEVVLDDSTEATKDVVNARHHAEKFLDSIGDIVAERAKHLTELAELRSEAQLHRRERSGDLDAGEAAVKVAKELKEQRDLTAAELDTARAQLRTSQAALRYLLEAHGAHADDTAVEMFAAVMKSTLAKQRGKGRGGWEYKKQVTGAQLSKMLREHVEKGDPVDVANL